MGRFFGKLFGEGKITEKDNEPNLAEVGKLSPTSEDKAEDDMLIEEAKSTIEEYLSRDHVKLMVTNAPSDASEEELKDRKIYDRILTTLVTELKSEGASNPSLIDNVKNNTAKDLEEHLAKKYNRVKPTSGMRPILTDYNSKD